MNPINGKSRQNGVSMSRLSMRRRSIIIFSMSVTFLVAFFSVFIFRATSNNVQGFYREASLYAVKANAAFLENRLDSYLEDLKRISEMPLMNERDLAKLNQTLAIIEDMERPPYVFGLYFADESGDFYVKNGRKLNFKSDPFFDAFYS
ncbi:MAG: hypothetical protein IJR40_09430, partial [Treponema sp.]|nr:hypothetical protein [Treponema sp.]